MQNKEDAPCTKNFFTFGSVITITDAADIKLSDEKKEILHKMFEELLKDIGKNGSPWI